MKTAAVVPALGIGDALLMMITSHQLKKKGYSVTTFHSHLNELTPWFPGHIFSSVEPSIETLASFDRVIIENDNSPKIKTFIAEMRSKLHLFYPTHHIPKHGVLHTQDFAFDPQLTMAENIARATSILLEIAPSKDNGLTPLEKLIYRKNSKVILIHPTSRVPKKNWLSSHFLTLAYKLRKKGYRPVFCVSPNEELCWEFVRKQGFELIVPSNLSALAALTYESGFVIGNDSLMGHLGSNLGLPALVIANDKKRMHLWRPGFRKSEVVLPPTWLPNKLKENHWQSFIRPTKVLRHFEKFSIDS